MSKEKEISLILFFYEKDKSVSFERIYAKYPLEESSLWDENKGNYFINRGGVKFFFQLDYLELEKSWGLEIDLGDNIQSPSSIIYLIVEKVLPIQNPISPNPETNKYIKELHFYIKKKVSISDSF